MNLNEVARCVSLREGLKEQVNIAQIKEIIKVLFFELYHNYNPDDILATIRKTYEKWEE